MSPCGTPLPQRTTGEIVATFFAVPLLMGIGLVAMVALTIVNRSGALAWQDWFSMAWAAAMSAGLLIGLPATGWQELWRRKAKNKSRTEITENSE